MKRWLLPALVLLALGCGRKEAPEDVVQILPAAVAEPEEATEPELVRKPQPAIQPDAVPDTAAADTGAAAPSVGRVITEEEYTTHRGSRGTMLEIQSSETKRTLTGYEVERAGGIFEAVKTVPGVIGK
ncbi:MAG: hypothetical protein JSU73_02840 [candidate division WOR-3 bacterium]|nr:MAG: hypothetical protein JSU73_02840 [candidate division WOR-3 bacterium]